MNKEKTDFFKDPQAQTILKDKYQLIVVTESVGSRRIASWQPVTQVLENKGIVKKIQSALSHHRYAALAGFDAKPNAMAKFATR